MNTYDVQFPGLFKDVAFEINRVAFTVFGKEIYWYGIIIVIGAIIGGFYAFWRAKKEGISADDMLDYAIFITIFSIVGARLYYVLTNLDQYHSFEDVISIRNGGLAIYGGVIAGALTVFIISRIKKIRFLKVADAIAPGLLIGQIIGRWANFINQEAFGVNTQLPWGMYSNATAKYLYAHQAELQELGMTVDPYAPVHPTFLYESLWNLLGFILIHFWIYRKKKYDGQIFYMYITWYGFGRMLIEGLRTDSLYIGTIRISQLVGFLCFIVGASLLMVFGSKAKKKAQDSIQAVDADKNDASAPETLPQGENADAPENSASDADKTSAGTEQDEAAGDLAAEAPDADTPAFAPDMTESKVQSESENEASDASAETAEASDQKDAETDSEEKDRQDGSAE